MRPMGEFDSLDDELFSEPLDYRESGPAPAVAFGVAPEPPTVRLVERDAGGDPCPAGPSYLAEPSYLDETDPDGRRDPLLAIALTGLLVLVLIGIGILLWWSA